MNGPELTPLQRLALAFYAFFAVLFRPDIAAAIQRVRDAQQGGARSPGPEEGWPPADRAAVEPARASRPDRPPAGGPVAHAQEAGAARPPEPAAKPPPPAAFAPGPSPAARPRAPDPARDTGPRAALQLLTVLQREGRLVDFIEEDLAGFPDSAVGAAARTVHAGCKRAIEELFRLEPVYREREGAQVEVGVGFDPATVRLTGNVVGKPPFRGSLRHHGWRAREVKLPVAADAKDPTIVAPAEVEL